MSDKNKVQVNEGVIKKGNTNPPPKDNRPKPPAGQNVSSKKSGS